MSLLQITMCDYYASPVGEISLEKGKILLIRVKILPYENRMQQCCWSGPKLCLGNSWGNIVPEWTFYLLDEILKNSKQAKILLHLERAP